MGNTCSTAKLLRRYEIAAFNSSQLSILRSFQFMRFTRDEALYDVSEDDVRSVTALAAAQGCAELPAAPAHKWNWYLLEPGGHPAGVASLEITAASPVSLYAIHGSCSDDPDEDPSTIQRVIACSVAQGTTSSSLVLHQSHLELQQLRLVGIAPEFVNTSMLTIQYGGFDDAADVADKMLQSAMPQVDGFAVGAMLLMMFAFYMLTRILKQRTGMPAVVSAALRRICICSCLAASLLVASRTLMLSLLSMIRVGGLSGERNPINMLLWHNVHDRGRSVFSTADLAWAANLRGAWREIRDEFNAFEQKLDVMGHHVKGHGHHTDTEAKPHWSGRKGWKQVLLMHMGEVDWAVAEEMPTTMRYVLAWGTPITSAWFSILEPNATIPRHTGEYKGILRYHLGIEVPDAEAMAASESAKASWFESQIGPVATYEALAKWLSKQGLEDEVPIVPTRGLNTSMLAVSHAALGVCSHEDGTPNSDVHAADVLHYAPGEDFMFDDNFIHFVANHAHNRRRVVLFVDVVRSDLPWWLTLFNRLFCYYVAPSSSFVRRQSGDVMASQTAFLASVGMPSDVANWYARGRFLAVHLAVAIQMIIVVALTIALIKRYYCSSKRRRLAKSGLNSVHCE